MQTEPTLWTRQRRANSPMKGEQRMNNGRVNKRIFGAVLGAAALLMYNSIFIKIGWG